MKPKIKVCGMKYNTAEVAMLQPDYLGFIFYEKSPRNFEGVIPKLPNTIKKVGVFVNATKENVIEKIRIYKLNVIQLHGEETPQFCKELKSEVDTKIIKVFSVKDAFDFSILEPYEDVVDYYLFDTKGKEKGGNGIIFNWDILKHYPSTKPFILSGGIGSNVIEDLKKFITSSLPLYAIDVNSKFETKPGLKNIDTLKNFINEL
jgi:phosphoribosylanthranilate isomerase